MYENSQKPKEETTNFKNNPNALEIAIFPCGPWTRNWEREDLDLWKDCSQTFGKIFSGPTHASPMAWPHAEAIGSLRVARPTLRSQAVT